MMMMMYFHYRIGEPILFREWLPQNLLAYIFSCFGIFLIAFGLEVLKFVRSRFLAPKIAQKSATAECCCSNNEGIWEIPETRPLKFDNQEDSIVPFTRSSLLAKSHIFSSILLFLQHFIDYSLMLVAMTYNIPIVLSLFAGHTVGYFVVGPMMSLEQADSVGGCCS
ncbi:unnamed protein product [Caenorhabditis angaria]|uniref:Copper transport protein n=1 Tax=Caenorhabditis angaria TaxID=860376 RepID=A0A9P1IQR1_9PELO|nr:unnamed protein product [Caenorhabditis angaria]